MAVVVDASAATQIAIGSEDGLAMQSFIMEGEEIIAPNFLQLECANSFWKYVHANKLSLNEAQEYYLDSINLVTRFVSQYDLLDEVFATAARLDHTVYDILYLVLARRMAATLMSFDRKLIDLCEAEGISCVVPMQV